MRRAPALVITLLALAAFAPATASADAGDRFIDIHPTTTSQERLLRSGYIGLVVQSPGRRRIRVTATLRPLNFKGRRTPRFRRQLPFIGLRRVMDFTKSETRRTSLTLTSKGRTLLASCNSWFLTVHARVVDADGDPVIRKGETRPIVFKARARRVVPDSLRCRGPRPGGRRPSDPPKRPSQNPRPEQPVPKSTCPDVSATAPERRPPGALYGLHLSLSTTGQDVPLATDAVAQHLAPEVGKDTLRWDRLEASPGNFDWRRPDASIAAMTAKGIEPMFVFMSSPRWANGAEPGTPDPSAYVPPSGPEFDAWVLEYRQFIGAAVDRYKHAVNKWEVWTEANGRFTWKPAPDPVQYAEFFEAMKAEIKLHDPDAEIALGGVGNIGAGPPEAIEGVRFVRETIRNGARPDIVAVHPYTSKSQAPDVHLRFQNNFDGIADVREELIRLGRVVPMWVTEWGWSGTGDGSESWSTPPVDQETQARYVYCSLNLLATTYSYVRLATYFLAYDTFRFGYGLLDRSLAPKQAAPAFRKFVEGS